MPNVQKGDIIEISFVGYLTETIKWNGKPINIILKEDTQTLEEVVVVGYGVNRNVPQCNNLHFLKWIIKC